MEPKFFLVLLLYGLILLDHHMPVDAAIHCNPFEEEDYDDDLPWRLRHIRDEENFLPNPLWNDKRFPGGMRPRDDQAFRPNRFFEDDVDLRWELRNARNEEDFLPKPLWDNNNPSQHRPIFDDRFFQPQVKITRGPSRLDLQSGLQNLQGDLTRLSTQIKQHQQTAQQNREAERVSMRNLKATLHEAFGQEKANQLEMPQNFEWKSLNGMEREIFLQKFLAENCSKPLKSDPSPENLECWEAKLEIESAKILKEIAHTKRQHERLFRMLNTPYNQASLSQDILESVENTTRENEDLKFRAKELSMKYSQLLEAYQKLHQRLLEQPLVKVAHAHAGRRTGIVLNDPSSSKFRETFASVKNFFKKLFKKIF